VSGIQRREQAKKGGEVKNKKREREWHTVSGTQRPVRRGSQANRRIPEKSKKEQKKERRGKTKKQKKRAAQQKDTTDTSARNSLGHGQAYPFSQV
jgi:hypothetical protein